MKSFLLRSKENDQKGVSGMFTRNHPFTQKPYMTTTEIAVCLSDEGAVQV